MGRSPELLPQGRGELARPPPPRRDSTDLARGPPRRDSSLAYRGLTELEPNPCRRRRLPPPGLPAGPFTRAFEDATEATISSQTLRMQNGGRRPPEMGPPQPVAGRQSCCCRGEGSSPAPPRWHSTELACGPPRRDSPLAYRDQQSSGPNPRRRRRPFLLLLPPGPPRDPLRACLRGRHRGHHRALSHARCHVRARRQE
jgi:hypothetical protein